MFISTFMSASTGAGSLVDNLPTSLADVASFTSSIISNAGIEILFFIVTAFVALSFGDVRRKTRPSSKPVDVSKMPPEGRAPRRPPLQKGPVHADAPAFQSEVPKSNACGKSSTSLPPCTTFKSYVEQVIATRISTSKALSHYMELRAVGKHHTFDADLAASGSKYTAVDLYAALVQCAGRAGRPQCLEELLDDMAEAGLVRSVALYESAMKLLAAKKFFKEAISVYDRFERDGLRASPTTLSCLVGFASEIGERVRATDFFKKLCEQDTPSIRACTSILRVYAKEKDWESSLNVLHELSRRSVPADSIVLNLALSTGVAVGEIETVERMLGEEPWKIVADVVSYNIVLKGLANLGKLHRALDLLYLMPQRGVEPNLITFNTAMDAAVRANKSSDAWRLFDVMSKAGMHPDKCTCSTLIKGFYQNHDETTERLEIMLDVIDGVMKECSRALLNSLLSGCLEASVRICSVPLAMRSFGAMRDQDVPLTAGELKGLLSMVAQASDIENCKMVWLYAATIHELVTPKQIFDRLVLAGHSIDAATLSALEMQNLAQ